MREVLVAVCEEANRGMIKLRHLLSITVVPGLLLLVPQVYADILPTPPALSFSVGGTTVFECGDGASCDSSAVDGVVAYAGLLNGYTFTVTTGLTKPALDGTQMKLNSVSVQAPSSGVDSTLEIMFSQTGFTQLDGGAFASFLGMNYNTSVSYQTYFDTSNTLFGLGTLIGDSGVQSGGSFNGAYYGAGPSSPTGPYSMTQKITITSNGRAGAFLGSFAVQVPEPTGVVELLGAALLVAFGAKKWQFRRS
jgi:hypothetical protein